MTSDRLRKCGKIRRHAAASILPFAVDQIIRGAERAQREGAVGLRSWRSARRGPGRHTPGSSGRRSAGRRVSTIRPESRTPRESTIRPKSVGAQTSGCLDGLIRAPEMLIGRIRETRPGRLGRLDVEGHRLGLRHPAGGTGPRRPSGLPSSSGKWCERLLTQAQFSNR